MRRARVEVEVWESRVPAHMQLYDASMKQGQANACHAHQSPHLP